MLREGVKGPITPIRVPGAPSTGAAGINDRGQVVGGYANPNATPAVQATGMRPLRMTDGALVAG